MRCTFEKNEQGLVLQLKDATLLISKEPSVKTHILLPLHLWAFYRQMLGPNYFHGDVRKEEPFPLQASELEYLSNIVDALFKTPLPLGSGADFNYHLANAGTAYFSDNDVRLILEKNNALLQRKVPNSENFITIREFDDIEAGDLSSGYQKYVTKIRLTGNDPGKVVSAYKRLSIAVNKKEK